MPEKKTNEFQEKLSNFISRQSTFGDKSLQSSRAHLKLVERARGMDI